MKTNTTQQNIPKGWTTVKVGDIGSTYSGLRSKNKSDFGHGSPFITYMNIFSNSKIDKNRFDLVTVGVGENQDMVKYGDIFFTVSSETPEEVGMSSVLLDEIDGYYLNSFCFGFRLNNFNFLLPDYARYLFRGKDFRSKIIKMAQGSTRFNLSKERVISLDITLPPVKEQQKIAEILGTVDEDIAKTQEVIEATEKLKRGLMQQLFTRGIGHTKFKETKIGNIPEEWRVGTLDEITEKISVGFVGTCEPFYTDESGVPMLRTGNLKEWGIDISDLKYVTKEFHIKNKKSQINSGDILIARHGENGLACLIPEGFGESNCLNVVIIRPNKEILDSMYLFYAINSPLARNQIEAKTGGSTQKVVNTSDIKLVSIGIPRKAEQQKIAEILSAVDEKISINKKLKAKLTLLKKGLMQDLLGGKVRTITN